MLKLIVLTGTSIWLLLGAPALVAACIDMRPGANHLEVMSAGKQERVDIVLPGSFDADKRSAGHPTAKGFAVMFPDGGIQRSGADGAAAHYCVDSRRIYVTGFSGGARMSSMLGCRLADRIAAVAPVAGLRAGRAAGPQFVEPDAMDCRPTRPIPVLAIHGTDDDTNPFPGGGGGRAPGSVDAAAGRV